MNFENYNKIYQEILDNNQDISANYLMNKYEISQEVELINILNQIKKNEYISSDNTLISKILKELDENEELLDINEIINIKEKIIDVNFAQSNDIAKSEPQNDYQSNSAQQQATNKQTVDNNISNHNPDINSNKKEEQTQQNKTVSFDISKFINKTTLIYSSAAGLVIILFFSLFVSSTSTNEIEIEKISQVESNNNKVALVEHDIDKIVTSSGDIELSETTEKEDNAEPQQTLAIVNNDQEDISEKELAAINETKQVSSSTYKTEDTNQTIKLNSLDEIENYVKDMHFSDGNLYFKNTAYRENDKLFGFKIYKLTSMYVKFEDESNQIRKRYVINK